MMFTPEKALHGNVHAIGNDVHIQRGWSKGKFLEVK
jgi:hypothetical protein